MAEFVFLYRRTPTPPGTPQEMQAQMERWRAWFKGLEDKGHLVNLGKPLAPTSGRVVKDNRGAFSDGPYAETKDVVMGYSLISAKDLDEATALTKGHPLFDTGGMVEIRPLMEM